jgi:hypothetical protein
MKYLIWTALSGLFLFGVTSATQAQTCGNYRTYRSTSVYSSGYTYGSSYYQATPHSTPVVYSTPYVAPYVASYVPPMVKKVVEYKKEDPYYLKFVAVVPLVELPTYSAYYTPPYNPVQPPPSQAQTRGLSKEDFKEIVDLIKGLDSRMKALEGKAPLTPLAPADSKLDSKTDGKADGKTDAKVDTKIPDIRLVNQQKCAICHQRGNEAKGGRFILSEADGSIVRLNNEQLGELDEQLSTNAMPKINATSKAAKITPLTDEEYAAFRQEISRQRAINKKK